MEGVGAFVFEVPAYGTVYQLKDDPLDPEAVNWFAVAPWQ